MQESNNMKFHEKSLELNITHELLNLADSWGWFLMNSTLWKYWTPGARIPFIHYPKSTAGGLHKNLEGRIDPTGNAGGGYDVRIKSGKGNHLLFIQYKKGDLCTSPKDPKSIFNTAPHDHFEFVINSKQSEQSEQSKQHSALRELAKGIGSEKGNAVVYAFPLIEDMNDLERNAGKIIRRTKFISVSDIDKAAAEQYVDLGDDKNHKFKIGIYDLNRCEVNSDPFKYNGKDRTAEVITDFVLLKFQKSFSAFYNVIRLYTIGDERLSELLKTLFYTYINHLFHYFEVSPENLNIPFIIKGVKEKEFYLNRFKEYHRDIEILSSILKSLEKFDDFIKGISGNLITANDVPLYHPNVFMEFDSDEDMIINFKSLSSKEVIEDIVYYVV